MVKLNAGNVMLKPSHRRQVMKGLRRSVRFGSRLGNFALTIGMQRIGRNYEVWADVNDSAGTFRCRARRSDWNHAVRDLTGAITRELHEKCLRHVATA